MTVITFVMTPIYLRELGNYDYGLWEVIVSLVGYLGILDLGLRPTISRYTAFYTGEHGGEAVSPKTVFATSLCLMTLVGVIAASAVFGWSLYGAGILTPVEGDSGRYAFVLQILAVRLLFTFPFYALESTLEGRLWYTTKNNINISLASISSTFLYFNLAHYDPLILLTATTAAQSFSKLVLFYALLKTETYGAYAFEWRSLDFSFAKNMLRFGSKSFTQGIAGKLTARADPLIIAGILGPQLVPFYVIPNNLLGRSLALNQVLTHVLMPAFSRMHSSGDSQGMERYFFFGSKLALGLHVAICVGILVLGDAFIALWISAEYAERARLILYIMVTARLVQGTLPLHNRLLTAMDRHGRLALVYLYRAVTNVGLTALFLYLMGLVGAVVATLIVNIVFLPFIWRLVFRNVRSKSIWEYISDTLIPTFVCGGLMGCAVYAASSGRAVDGWSELAALVAVGLVTYPVLFWFVVMKPHDRSRLRSLRKRAFQTA